MYALSSRFISLDTKHRKIQLARWCALAVISLIWVDGERSCAMTIPRSRLALTHGKTVSCTRYLTSKGTCPIINTMHLVTEFNIKSRAPCNFSVGLSMAFTISKYTYRHQQQTFLQLYHDFLTIWPIHQCITNKTGPIPLHWTPLRRLAVSDRHCPTLVWCVRSLRKFWCHFKTSPQIPYECRWASNFVCDTLSKVRKKSIYTSSIHRLSMV